MEDDMTATPRHYTWILSCLASFFLVFLLCSTPLNAQNSRGTILGHVSDPSGAAVVGAKVTVLNASNSVSTVFTTNSAGDYVFVNLVPGTYEITIEGQGFKTERGTGLVLEVDQTLRQDYQLTLGTISERVEVSTATQMVQTDN